MKLNKEQRLTMYLIMMAEIEYAESIHRLSWTTETCCGFCYMVEYLTEDINDDRVLFDHLTELMQQSPDFLTSDDYWFNNDVYGWLQRKELLQRTIDTMLTA